MGFWGTAFGLGEDAPGSTAVLNNAAEDETLQKGAVAVMRGLDNIPAIIASSFVEMDAKQEQVLTTINIKAFPNANVI